MGRTLVVHVWRGVGWAWLGKGHRQEFTRRMTQGVTSGIVIGRSRSMCWQLAL